MAMTALTGTRITDTTWLLYWASGLASPTFYVYVDGVLAYTTTAQSGQFEAIAGETINVEVFDSSTDVPALFLPSRLHLTWDAVDDAEYYEVQEWDGVDSWDVLATIMSTGATYYRYETPVLDDCTTYQFRIVPTGTNRCEGHYREITGFVVRIPAAPDVVYTLPSRGK